MTKAIMNVRLQNMLMLLLLVSLNSCSRYPETPEEVVKQFVTDLSLGECENAMNLCTKTAKESVQAIIDIGCEPYETTIDSILCDTQVDEAFCRCFETRKSTGEVSYSYELEKTEGKWLLRENTKVDLSLEIDLD